MLYGIFNPVNLPGEGYHVLVEPGPVYVRIAPVHVGLTVVVNKHRRINVFPMFLLPYQRMSQRVLERAEGAVGHQHADAVSMDGAVHVELAIPFHHAFRPGSVGAVVPFEIGQRGHGPVVFPVHHVRAGVQEPVVHLEALGSVLIVCGIKVYCSVIDHGRRIGREFGLNERHVQVVVEHPPVQVEEFLISAPEKQIKVVNPFCACVHGRFYQHVFPVHRDGGNGPSAQFVQEEVHGAGTLEIKHLQRNQHSRLVAEVHVTHL